MMVLLVEAIVEKFELELLELGLAMPIREDQSQVELVGESDFGVLYWGEFAQ